MAGIPGKGGVKGRSGPPGNQNAFKHGLAAIQKRREESITTEYEKSIRQQILEGLIADKGGDDQVSTATRILAEVIASDAAWLMVFNGAIDHIIQNRRSPDRRRELRTFRTMGSPEQVSRGRTMSDPLKNWWSRWELNPRPLECDSSALPTELRPQN